MINLFRKYFWFLFIAFQSLLGLLAGFLLLSSIGTHTVPAGTRMGGLSIGNLSFTEIEPAVSSYYGELEKNGALIIEIDRTPLKLSYASIDAFVDAKRTAENIRKSVPQNELEKFFNVPVESSVWKPVFTYNSGKLLGLCEQLFAAYQKEPVPEYYEVDQDILKYNPQVPGLRVDYGVLEQELKARMFSVPEEKLAVDIKTSPIFVKAAGNGIYKEPFTTLVSKAAIALEPELLDKARKAVAPLDGVVFEGGQDINLGSLIDFSHFTSDIDKDLLNRIATALYQTDLPIDGVQTVHRKPSKRAVAYTEAGLEAVIEGEEANLILKNDTGRPLMLLADAGDTGITFYMASTGDIKSGILIVQKENEVPPPVITSVNKDLSPKQTKVVSEGIPGFTAIVSRVIDDDRVELYRDQYQPVSKLVESGEKPRLTTNK